MTPSKQSLEDQEKLIERGDDTVGMEYTSKNGGENGKILVFEDKEDD